MTRTQPVVYYKIQSKCLFKCIYWFITWLNYNEYLSPSLLQRIYKHSYKLYRRVAWMIRQCFKGVVVAISENYKNYFPVRKRLRCFVDSVYSRWHCSVSGWWAAKINTTDWKRWTALGGSTALKSRVTWVKMWRKAAACRWKNKWQENLPVKI